MSRKRRRHTKSTLKKRVKRRVRKTKTKRGGASYGTLLAALAGGLVNAYLQSKRRQ